MNIKGGILFLAMLVSIASIAQIRTGEEPVTIPQPTGAFIKSGIVSNGVQLPPLTQEMIDAAIAKHPFQYVIGTSADVDLSPDKIGQWSVLSDGSQVWQIEIGCDGVEGLGLSFDRFVLPPKAKLFLYNENGSLGAYTAANLQPDSTFTIQPIPGTMVTVQLVLPPTPSFDAEVHIVKTGLYFSCGSPSKVACIPSVDQMGEEWEDNINASVMLLFQIGGGQIGLCSGTILNTPLGTDTVRPFLLSAGHCIYGDESVPSLSQSVINQTIIIFDFQEPEFSGCWGSYTNQNKFSSSMLGMKLLATADDLDFSFYQLYGYIPPNYNPYFAGWDATSQAPVYGAGIHHPGGFDKRYVFVDSSTAITSTTATVQLDDKQEKTYVADAHWEIAHYSQGVVIPGSSGSALLDQNKRVVGDLTGGSSACGKYIYSDVYQKFGYAWDYYDNLPADSSRQLKYWLDPNNVTDGLYNGKGAYNVFLVAPAECSGDSTTVGAQKIDGITYTATTTQGHLTPTNDTIGQIIAFGFKFENLDPDTIQVIEYEVGTPSNTPTDTFLFPFQPEPDGPVTSSFTVTVMHDTIVLVADSTAETLLSYWTNDCNSILAEGFRDTIFNYIGPSLTITHTVANHCQQASSDTTLEYPDSLFTADFTYSISNDTTVLVSDLLSITGEYIVPDSSLWYDPAGNIIGSGLRDTIKGIAAPEFEITHVISFECYKDTAIDTLYFPQDSFSADFTYSVENYGLVVEASNAFGTPYSDWYDAAYNHIGEGHIDTLMYALIPGTPTPIIHVVSNGFYADTTMENIAPYSLNDLLRFPTGANSSDYIVDTIPFAYDVLTLQIYNMGQQIVSQQTYKNNETNIISIAIGRLSPGLYILHIALGEGSNIQTAIRKILRANP